MEVVMVTELTKMNVLKINSRYDVEKRLDKELKTSEKPYSNKYMNGMQNIAKIKKIISLFIMLITVFQ